MSENTNARGILLMIASMGAFGLADTLVKVSTTLMSPAQVMFYLIAGALIIFAIMVVVQGNRLFDRRALTPVLLLRYVAEIAGMVGMVLALAQVPISVVGAVTQASPMFATVGAYLFLKENVGWRRWCSIIVGFIGVLLIIQPGAVEFELVVLWAVLAMVALSVRDLTTRLIPSDMASSSLAFYTMAAATPFAIGWVMVNGESLLPDQINWFVVIPMVVLGALGYMLLIASIRISEVSVVMPFRYSRIIFLLLIGMIVFDEKPGLLMILGAALIIAAGSYMMWRERVVRHGS